MRIWHVILLEKSFQWPAADDTEVRMTAYRILRTIGRTVFFLSKIDSAPYKAERLMYWSGSAFCFIKTLIFFVWWALYDSLTFLKNCSVLYSSALYARKKKSKASNLLTVRFMVRKIRYIQYIYIYMSCFSIMLSKASVCTSTLNTVCKKNQILIILVLAASRWGV